MDLDTERPPLLYPDHEPIPTDAWDVQVPVPAPVFAFVQRAHAHGRPWGVGAGLGVGSQRAYTTLMTALRDIPMRSAIHEGPGVWPHLHMLVGMRDIHDQPVDQARVEQAAADAWIAQTDRIVDYTTSRPELGMHWTHHAITGLDHTGLPEFTCTGFYNGGQPVIVGHP